MHLRLLASALVIASLSACGAFGREDVELAGPSTSDGGLLTCEPPAAARACLANGAACSVGVECCSSRCEGLVCLEAGTCAAPGATCASRAACCSGRCEPVDGTTNRACLDYCRADGAACARALDCCSMGCHDGLCGSPLCQERDGSCKTAADCCSNHCGIEEGKCVTDSATLCRATGESCESGGGELCCGACDEASHRCQFGPGPCLPSGAICAKDGDCCRGTCAQGEGEVRVCSAPCLADGAACAGSADCCGHQCNGSPGKCGAAAAACQRIGAACGRDLECCSGQCLGGACGNNCQP